MGTGMNRTPFPLEERLRLWKCGRLSSQFPIVMVNGHEWQSLTGYCSKCHKEIKEELLHGEICSTFKGIWSVRCVGLCRDCELTTCFFYNFKDDQTVTGYDSEGKWRRWEASRVWPWQQAYRWLKGLFR